MSFLGNFITFGLNQAAAKKQQQLQQAMLDTSTGTMHSEFDRRMAALGGSDQALIDLSKRQFADTGANADQTFKTLLDNAQQGFQAQQTLSDETAGSRLKNNASGFDEGMGALDNLMTAQKAARLQSKAFSDSERERQIGFQDQADAEGADLPGQIGVDAQTQARTRAFDDRSALIKSVVSPTTAPAFARQDPGVAAAFAGQAARGTDAAIGDELAKAGLSSYGDAFRGAEHKLGDFAGDISALTNKAVISRGALPAELGLGKLASTQAQQKYEFASGLAKTRTDQQDALINDRGSRLSSAQSDYTGSIKDATGAHGQSIAQLLSDYYGGMTDAQRSYIDGVVGNSTNLQNALIALNNFRMGNTRVSSPLAALVGMTDQAVEEAAKAAAAGG